MIICPTCGCVGCLIGSDLFADGTLTGWTTTGTWSESGGLLVGTGAGQATFDTSVPQVGSAIRVYTFPLNTSTDGTVRLKVCQSDTSNYLFGELAIAGTAGTIRLGQVVGGASSYLTDAVTLDDTGAELDARSTLCLSFDPGDLQEAESFVMGGVLATEATGASWSSPENITAIDDSPASQTLGTPTPSVTGDLIGQAFPVVVPPGSTIDGVAFGARCREGTGGATVTRLTKMIVSNSVGTGDDLADNQQLTGEWADLGGGGPTSNLGLTLTWQNIGTLAVTLAFTFVSTDEFSSQTVFVEVDAVWVDVYFTTPERRPGRLRLSYTNTGAPQNSQCVTEYSAENPASGLKTGIQIVSGNWDFTEYHVERLQSVSRPTCGVCACTAGEAAEPCECCDPAFPPAAAYVVDLGAGGWTDAICSFCDTVAGEYLLSALGACLWHYNQAIDCPANTGSTCYPRALFMGLALVSDGVNCKWRFTINWAGVCDPAHAQAGFGALYESANLASAEDCQALPVTLSKVFASNSVCGGDLPATVTLEAA